MIIKKLVLHGYRRLFLNNIEHLEYIPESNVQILLGSNGSGKSSILKELSPLPANLKREYNEDGYKYIEVEHNHREYIVSSGKVSRDKHSCIVDNIELNPGGTKKVQLELIEEHFGITPNVFNIILGSDKLTTMSFSDRKRWLTSISNVDYTYGIHIYNKLRSRHRDIIGGVKLLNSNIIKYKGNTLSDNELKSIEEDISVLTELVEHMLSLYDHKLYNIPDSDVILNNLNKLVISYSKLDIENIDSGVVEYENIVNKYKIELEVVNKRILTIKDKIVKLDSVRIDTSEVDSIRSKLKLVNNNVTKILESVYIEDIDMNNIDNIYQEYTHISTDLTSILSTLNEYKDIDSSRDRYNKYREESELYIINIRKLETKILKLEEHNKHMMEHNTSEYIVNCPKCTYSWNIHYDDDKYKNNIKILEKSYIELKLIKSNSNKVDELLKSMTIKRDIIKTLLELIKGSVVLKPIWLHIFNGLDLHTIDSNIILTKLNSVTINLQKWVKYSDYIKDKKELDNKLKTIEVKLNTVKDMNGSNIEELDKELSRLLASKYDIENNINKIKIKLGILTKSIDIVTNIRKELTNVRWLLKNYKEVERNKYLKRGIAVVKDEILDKSRSIELDKLNRSKLNDDIKELKNLEIREKVTKLLHKALSPNEGLIAKSINSFLNLFISDINNIINTIWTYDMVLLPCNIGDGDDLDYKFPVKVDNNEIIEDVSKLSSSMREIVDLAFKIVFMKYKQLTEIPLILDEFGSTFDDTHRTAAYDTIDKLLTSDFIQTFIVSHYQETYLRFGHADISILSTDNINTNDINSYNKVMKITHG